MIEGIFLHCDECAAEMQVSNVTRDLIGTPCPACGADMLTAEDYVLGKRHERVMRVIQKIDRVVRPFWRGKPTFLVSHVKDGRIKHYRHE